MIIFFYFSFFHSPIIINTNSQVFMPAFDIRFKVRSDISAGPPIAITLETSVLSTNACAFAILLSVTSSIGQSSLNAKGPAQSPSG